MKWPVAALLASLSPDDRVKLAGCDVTCDWALDGLQPATEENVSTVRDFLDERVSLGWTDLDEAFAAALAQCGPNTQILATASPRACRW